MEINELNQIEKDFYKQLRTLEETEFSNIFPIVISGKEITHFEQLFSTHQLRESFIPTVSLAYKESLQIPLEIGKALSDTFFNYFPDGYFNGRLKDDD